VKPTPALVGQTVLVTRPEARTATLTAALVDAGAHVRILPTIRIVPPSDPEPLATAASGIADYDWVVVSSVNAVERLVVATEAAGTSGALRRQRVAAIGPATAEALRLAGCPSPLTPEIFRGEALADAILAATSAGEVEGLRILVARAENARAVLPERLQNAGARVEIAPAYRTVVNAEARTPLLELVEFGELDWLTFTASSTVRAFVELAGAQTGGASVVAISPVTAATIVEVGLPVHAVATEHSVAGLVDALAEAVTAVVS